MNEDEKEAIEILQGLCTDDCVNNDIVKTIVKLIEKQQKEIEELKTITRAYNSYICDDVNFKFLIADARYFFYDGGYFVDRFISKDKIRKLKELVHKTLDDNGITRGYQLTIDNYFKELLEE